MEHQYFKRELQQFLPIDDNHPLHMQMTHSKSQLTVPLYKVLIVNNFGL